MNNWEREKRREKRKEKKEKRGPSGECNDLHLE